MQNTITSSANTELSSDRWRLVGNQIKEIINSQCKKNDFNKAVVESNIRNLLNGVTNYNGFVDIGFYVYLDKFIIAPKNDYTFAIMCRMGLY